MRYMDAEVISKIINSIYVCWIRFLNTYLSAFFLCSNLTSLNVLMSNISKCDSFGLVFLLDEIPKMIISASTKTLN